MKFGFDQHVPADRAEEIPAEFRPLYTETEDGFTLDESYGGVREAILGLNKALGAARNEAKTYKGKQVDLSVLNDFGETPEGIRDAFEEKLKAAQTAAAQAGDEDAQRRLEKVRAELNEQNQKVLEEKDSVISQYRSQLESVLGEGAARAALTGKAVDPDLALPFVLKHLRTVEDSDGNLQVVVVDSDGDVRENPTTAQPVSINDLVEELRADEKYGRLFASETPSGGDARPNPRPTSAPRRPARDMKPVEKIAAGLRKGQARNARGMGKIN